MSTPSASCGPALRTRRRGDRALVALLLAAAASSLQAGDVSIATRAADPPLAAGTFEEARGWLERMNQALATRNYDGIYVLQHGRRREALRIIHRFENGKVSERLVSVDGSGREFVRNGTELTCYFPDRRVVIVEKRPEGQGFIDALPGLDASAAASYDVGAVERRTVRGRATRVIALTPRDEFRYGYRLWIDEKTAMPIKTQLCDVRGNVIEQMEFASLTLASRIDDALLRPEISTEGFRWLRHDAHPPRPKSAPFWQAKNLPPGFRMSARADQGMPGLPGPVSHFVFTDGIASVSVFIEGADRGGGAPPMDGPAQMGSAAAYSLVVNGHRVTAVGEVPPLTVRSIAEALRTGEERSAPPAFAGPGTARPPSSASPAAPPPPPSRSSEMPALRQAPERNALRP